MVSASSRQACVRAGECRTDVHWKRNDSDRRLENPDTSRSLLFPFKILTICLSLFSCCLLLLRLMLLLLPLYLLFSLNLRSSS